MDRRVPVVREQPDGAVPELGERWAGHRPPGEGMGFRGDRGQCVVFIDRDVGEIL